MKIKEYYPDLLKIARLCEENYKNNGCEDCEISQVCRDLFCSSIDPKTWLIWGVLEKDANL
jgi:hypothetical protein